MEVGTTTTTVVWEGVIKAATNDDNLGISNYDLLYNGPQFNDNDICQSPVH